MVIHAPTLASETIAQIGSFQIRNTMLMAWMTMAVLTLIGLLMKIRGYKLVPGRFQMLLELSVEGLFDLFNSVFGNTATTRRFFPMLATMFFFMLIANWMGILPGVGSILVTHGEESIPLFRSMNADVNMTLTFALFSVIFAQIMGLVTIGILPHIGKYLVPPWKQPYVIGTFVGILELVGEIARIVSFSFRLFGNIFAGEVLLVVVAALVPYVAPIPFLGMEIFVGFIQAIVFVMLTVVFLSMAMTAHGDDHAAEQQAHA